jgi:hypothetical protein
MDPTAPWNFAIDPDTLVFHASDAHPGSLPSPIFESQAPSNTITATGCPVAWVSSKVTIAAGPVQLHFLAIRLAQTPDCGAADFQVEVGCRVYVGCCQWLGREIDVSCAL